MRTGHLCLTRIQNHTQHTCSDDVEFCSYAGVLALSDLKSGHDSRCHCDPFLKLSDLLYLASANLLVAYRYLKFHILLFLFCQLFTFGPAASPSSLNVLNEVRGSATRSRTLSCASGVHVLRTGICLLPGGA